MAQPNPFTPSFGEIPLVMAGRDSLMRSVEDALDAPGRSPELTLLLSGARGTGKTVLLSHIAETAQEHGWLSVNVTAGEGMLGEIYSRLMRAGQHVLAPKETKTLTGLGVAQMIELEWTERSQSLVTWRELMEDAIEELNAAGIGVLITVDEILPELDELVRLAAVYQHFIRERRKVALMMAGLPFNVDYLLKDKTVSFLRRAQRETVGRIPDFEIADALRRTVERGGRGIEDGALEYATEAIGGFPYMLQLVGYRTWQQSQDDTIAYDDVLRGCDLAAREFRERVLVSSYKELSDGDIAFLRAMLQDAGDSRLKDIEARLGKSSGYVNTYRRRLMAAGVIGERRRGVVGFDLPGFREFMDE